MAIRSAAADAAANHKLERSPVPPEVYQRPITFQLLDCLQSKREPLQNVSTLHHAEVPEIRLFGSTRSGHSVLVHVYNVEPYLWFEAPLGWNENLEPALRATLNEALGQATKVDDTVVRIETHDRQSLMLYQGGRKRKFLKVVTQLPGFVPKIRAVLTERGISFAQLFDGVMRFPTFESNVLFPLRYLVDAGISGASWVTVTAGQYRRTMNPGSSCQIEVDCSFEAIQAHEPVGEYMAIAPLRILSIDIECMGRKGHFPEADKDPVIQIANHCACYGSATPVAKTIFTLDTCAPIAGADVRCFRSEEEMLIAWSRFLTALDPDILTGYNITGFDFPYLLNRATALNITPKFAYWSRMRNEKCAPREKQFQSKQMGNRNYVEVAVDGRITMDVMVVIQRDHKLRSYSLNSVSQHFLGEQKEDVHHSIIADLQMGDEENRRRLAVYCLKDAYLPIRLIDKLMIVVNNVEMARVSGVPVGWLLERGQGIKVFSQMLRKAQTRGLLFPMYERREAGPPGIGYEGATVIDPETGFYDDACRNARLRVAVPVHHDGAQSVLLHASPQRRRAQFRPGTHHQVPVR
jgi:DNA polymerase delta subunit 1